MRFLDKIFKKESFIPRDAVMRGFSTYQGKYIDIKSKDDALTAYLLCPTVRAIVDKKAELFANFKLEEYTKSGVELENTPFLNVMAKPHPLYSEGEFWQTLSKQWDVFDEVFILINRENTGGLLKEGDTMLILPANDVKIKLNENYKPKLKKDENNKIVDYYEFNFKGRTIILQPYEVLHVSKTAINFKNYESADLRLQSCEGAINTILASYNVTNTLLNRNGGFFIFTNDAGDGGLEFNREIENTEIEKLQNDLKKYSFNRNEYNNIITNAKLKVQSISFPIKDMDLDGGTKRAVTDICNVLNYPIQALNNTDSSTYDNLTITDKKIYTDSIIPSWKIFENVFNGANLTLNEIEFDYSDISNLLEDKKTELETQKLNDEIQINRYKNGLITLNELRIEIGLDVVANGDALYISEPEKSSSTVDEVEANPEANAEQLTAQANLRGTVGGVQGILQIQASFVQGITSQSSAISILMEIYGFDLATARAILGV